MAKLDIGTMALSDQIMAYFRDNVTRLTLMAQSSEIEPLVSILAAHALMSLGADTMILTVNDDEDVSHIQEAIDTACKETGE